MPVIYRIDNQICEFRMIGGYTNDDFRQACRQSVADPGFHAPMMSLINLVQAHVNPPLEELEELASCMREFKHDFTPHWAALTQPNSLMYGLSRMISVFVEERGITLDVFTDRHKALAYLSEMNTSQSLWPLPGNPSFSSSPFPPRAA